MAFADVPGLRPTPDRVRETLFNWLQPHIVGARCLDLFAGSGALGLEALSRGAESTVFVDTSPVVGRVLQAQLDLLQAGHQARVVTAAAADYLMAAGDSAIDIVFLDPPFADGGWEEVVTALVAGGLLAADALIYIETPRDISPQLPQSWTVWRQTLAGQIRAAVYRRQASVDLTVVK